MSVTMLKLNTFSIAGRCERTGEVGVAVSTAVPAVGMLAPFAKSGVGAIATQSFVNPYLASWGLEYLSQGHSASETMEYLQTRDPEMRLRQVGIVDAKGGSAAFTGEDCDGWCGDVTGKNFSIQGNMLVDQGTLEAMQKSFESSQDKPLMERLIAALWAGQEAGGDKRGRQSAAAKVYHTEEYPALDLRVDEHPDPVRELRRVYEVAQEMLVPLISMLPTLKNPHGVFDAQRSRQLGLLQDDK